MRTGCEKVNRSINQSIKQSISINQSINEKTQLINTSLQRVSSSVPPCRTDPKIYVKVIVSYNFVNCICMKEIVYFKCLNIQEVIIALARLTIISRSRSQPRTRTPIMATLFIHQGSQTSHWGNLCFVLPSRITFIVINFLSFASGYSTVWSCFQTPG